MAIGLSEVHFHLWSYKWSTKFNDCEVGVHFVNHKYDYTYRLIAWHNVLLPIDHYNFQKVKVSLEKEFLIVLYQIETWGPQQFCGVSLLNWLL